MCTNKPQDAKDDPQSEKSRRKANFHLALPPTSPWRSRSGSLAIFTAIRLGLILREQLRRRSPPRLILEIDIR